MEQQQTVALPELVSPAFRELIRGASPKAAEALKREVYFSAAEDVAVDFEAEDPLGERYYRATDWSVHQYPNRLLVLTTGRCLSYCRYCFRREFTARELGFLSDAEWDAVLDYVAAHPQITEILLSGGDPLSMPFEVFRRVLLKIRSRFKNLLIRVCTRAPIFAPELFTVEMLALMHECKPLWLIPHINHPDELGENQVKALDACVNAGIPVQSQSVLLKGVNDEPELLAELFTQLVALGVKPGYLFQLDTARGTSHFAVPFRDALAIWAKLRNMLSGLSRPEFAVDLLDGGGKFSLSAVSLHDDIMEITETGFKVRRSDGKVYHYK
jgi:uncharacterized kamA family protein TP_0121